MIMEKMIDTIQLSGDAYYYLLNGEEPLDPDNLEEANEIAERYEYGIKFLGEPEPIDGTDMVETKISIPTAIKLAEDKVVIFMLLPDKLCKVKIADNYNSSVSLESIGDKYWAEYFNNGYGTRHLLPICKISDYEKWFGLKA